MSRVLPERCTLVIRNMRSSDFEKIKSFCSKRTSKVVEMAMSYDRRDPPFSGEPLKFANVVSVVIHWYRSPGDWLAPSTSYPRTGACRMFVDYSSEKDALRAQGLVADFLACEFSPNREFKPFVNIKGALHQDSRVNNIDIGSQVHNVGTGSRHNTSVLCATLNTSSQHDFCKYYTISV